MSKVVRTYTRTFEVEVSQVNAKEPFMTWRTFRNARCSRGLSTNEYSECVACCTRFEDDEDIFICVVVGEGNRFMCKICVEEFEDL